MLNTNQNHPQKTAIAFISLIIAFILVVITISIIIPGLANREEARIINATNETTVSETESKLSDEDLARVKKALYQTLNKTQSANQDFDAAIRWDTLKTVNNLFPYTSFLVDVDEYKQTYRVTVDQYIVNVNCPEIGESKYPKSFCLGNGSEYDDSISIVLGDQFPIDTRTSAGEYVSINRNDLTKTEDINHRYLEV